MALGTAIGLFGTALSDFAAADADKSKAQGLQLEGQEYDLASALATQNEKYTEESTAVQQYQLSRSINKTIGAQAADVAGSGFSSSGTALDLLRDSATQGALAKGVLANQGLITEAGYTEQAQSYTLMSQAAGLAAQAADKAASSATMKGFIDIGAAAFSLMPTPAPTPS